VSTKGTDWDFVEPKLTVGWLLALAYAHGWKSKWSQIRAVCVCLAESQGYARAWHINKLGEPGESLDQGLFQINTLHEYDGNIWNPWENVAMARRIYVGRGFKFTAWAANNSGAWLVHLPKVTARFVLDKWRTGRLPYADQWDLTELPAPEIPTP